MNKKIFKVSLILLLAFGLTSASFAQGRQTGSISGTVVDTEGNLLPGCTVTLSGPRLIGTKSYVTSEMGKFRFPSVAPGRGYELRVELPGFKTIIEKGFIISVARATTVKKLHNPSQLPPLHQIKKIEEPFLEALIITPDKYLGAVLKLLESRRGEQKKLEYISTQRIFLTYLLPLNEVVMDFYNQLKSVSQGYASTASLFIRMSSLTIGDSLNPANS